LNALPINYQFPELRFRRTGTRLFRLNSLSRFKDLEVVEYNDDQTVESWRRPEIAQRGTDKVYQVKQSEERRSDLVCRSIYLNTDLVSWVVLSQNLIYDPFTELIAGRGLRTPEYNRIVTTLVG